ncbi:hypothetical protein RvY_08384 [Ramazzottius varieornatus]|uniref:Uncharacterized protein n=1 Tax=Ramazzottius varieornatus TaxID=947166 RepID=A0A1D1V5Q2_RAMVA|nr:hypothetical protein RvY_08384 [Ramazzottius varieornatus]
MAIMAVYPQSPSRSSCAEQVGRKEDPVAALYAHWFYGQRKTARRDWTLSITTATIGH